MTALTTELARIAEKTLLAIAADWQAKRIPGSDAGDPAYQARRIAEAQVAWLAKPRPASIEDIVAAHDRLYAEWVEQFRAKLRANTVTP